MAEVKKFADLRDSLELPRFSAATELVRRLTAAERAAEREAAVVAAAFEGASALSTSEDTVQTAVLVMGLMGLDEIGIGGPQGLGGDCTQRISAFTSLGKGRKQAGDGPAWSAAIRASLAAGLKGGKLLFSPFEGELEVEVLGGTSNADGCNVRIPANEAGLARWVAAAAGLGLAAQVCGTAFPAGKIQQLAEAGIVFAGVKEDAPARAWAEVYDTATRVALDEKIARDAAELAEFSK